MDESWLILGLYFYFLLSGMCILKFICERTLAYTAAIRYRGHLFDLIDPLLVWTACLSDHEGCLSTRCDSLPFWKVALLGWYSIALNCYSTLTGERAWLICRYLLRSTHALGQSSAADCGLYGFAFSHEILGKSLAPHSSLLIFEQLFSLKLLNGICLVFKLSLVHWLWSFCQIFGLMFKLGYLYWKSFRDLVGFAAG